MARAIPTVGKWMSTAPITIDRDVTLERAHALMRAEAIRHLPIVEGDRLVGMVSRSDLRLIETLSGVDVERVSAAEAMTPEPYAVAPDAPLDEVAAAMAERKIGSAVVVEEGKVVGMFSAIDALRALTDLLRASGST
jgi:acetoin utilization protein AcuB